MQGTGRNLAACRYDKFKCHLACIKRDPQYIKKDPVPFKRDPLYIKIDLVYVNRDPVYIPTVSRDWAQSCCMQYACSFSWSFLCQSERVSACTHCVCVCARACVFVCVFVFVCVCGLAQSCCMQYACNFSWSFLCE